MCSFSLPFLLPKKDAYSQLTNILNTLSLNSACYSGFHHKIPINSIPSPLIAFTYQSLLHSRAAWYRPLKLTKLLEPLSGPSGLLFLEMIEHLLCLFWSSPPPGQKLIRSSSIKNPGTFWLFPILILHLPRSAFTWCLHSCSIFDFQLMFITWIWQQICILWQIFRTCPQSLIELQAP